MNRQRIDRKIAVEPGDRGLRTQSPKDLLDIRYLLAFVAVAECGGVAHASKKLSVSPSSVSRSIQRIEEYLGAPVLERRSRAAFLSPCGERILPYAQRAIEELRAIRRMPSEDRKSQIDSFEQLLNTRRLQMFVRLCEVRHMPSVGSEMGISQPAISLGVKTLEQGVGTALFERSARGLAPTRQALAIEPNCRRALKQLSFIPAEIALLRGSLAGVVNIGIVPVGPPLILPDAIAEVAASHADLRIVTWENSMEELIAGLRAGDIDFIFGPFSVSGEEGHLEAEALYEEDLALLVGQNNPLLEKKIVPEDLLHVRWVLPGAGAPARRLLDAAFMDAGLRPPVPVVESRDLTIVRGLLSSTDMVAALLSHQMAFEIAEGTIKRLPAVFDDAVSRIGFLYHAENGPSPTAKVMMDAIRRLARKYERRSADPAPRCS